jgi:hypothetical protein
MLGKRRFVASLLFCLLTVPAIANAQLKVYPSIQWNHPAAGMKRSVNNVECLLTDGKNTFISFYAHRNGGAPRFLGNISNVNTRNKAASGSFTLPSDFKSSDNVQYSMIWGQTSHYKRGTNSGTKYFIRFNNHSKPWGTYSANFKFPYLYVSTLPNKDAYGNWLHVAGTLIGQR